METTLQDYVEHREFLLKTHGSLNLFDKGIMFYTDKKALRVSILQDLTQTVAFFTGLLKQKDRYYKKFIKDCLTLVEDIPNESWDVLTKNDDISDLYYKG